MSTPYRPASDRLLDHLVEEDRGHETPCWIWTGFVMPNGYGLIWTGSESDRRNSLVHRIAYVAYHGEVPDGLPLDHLCRVRNCVNPDHLEPVTYAENNRRSRELVAK